MARYYNVPVGVYVRFMDSNGAAAEAGLQVGDIITGINGETISSSTELSAELKKYNAGDTIQVNYYRNGSELTVSVTLHEQTQDTNS
jgi:serine protease Do